MARASRALLLAAALVPARGELRILAGKYAGRSLPSPLHRVSADHFDVTAELVASNSTQWLQDSCPPTHVGQQRIEGRLVLFDFQPLVCSRESLARALHGYGAAGMISLGERSGLVPPVPGRSVYSHSNGDTREPLPLPMAFIAGELAHNIYRTIASGAPVRARLTPSPNIWINMWASPWWAVWQATLTFQSVIVLELALMRLYAFVREDHQPRLTIPQALLFIESLAHVQRIAFTAVDPYWSRGIYTDETAIWLLTNHLALASIGRALFLVYYAQSAMVMGILTARVSQPSWAATLVGVCVAVLVVDVLSSAFALHSLALTWVRGKPQPLTRSYMRNLPCARALFCCTLSRPSASPLRAGLHMPLACHVPKSDPLDNHHTNPRARALRARVLAYNAQAQVSPARAAQQGEDRHGPRVPAEHVRGCDRYCDPLLCDQPGLAGNHHFPLPLVSQRRVPRAGERIRSTRARGGSVHVLTVHLEGQEHATSLSRLACANVPRSTCALSPTCDAAPDSRCPPLR